MSDLINAAIEAIRASAQKYTGFMEMEMYTDDDAVEAIINLLSAQPEIIMCKDCIHSPAAHDDCPLPVQYVVPEGFCYLGRGKDEQGEV
jgi:hypothetical protein